MNLPRIYQPCPLIHQTQIELNEQAAHHLVQVLRHRCGDRLLIFNGKGGEYLAEIIAIGKKSVSIKLLEYRPNNPESNLKIHLGQGIARGEKMDFIIQKAVELGVQAITPLFTQRTNVKLSAEKIDKRLQHWQKVIISACEQSGRTILPQLHEPLSFPNWIKQQRTGLRLLLHPQAEHKLNQLKVTEQAITLAIGPEGGLAQEELAHAAEQGFQSLSLGPRILRTETAPLAIISILQSWWGDLG